ncbi:MAG: amino acid ABC transporter substrate-binding protein, partial [Acidobacteria bacterium]|nr:amino acid ABC transporter substrate-binding protein [Acidobacteriota bacterium]
MKLPRGLLAALVLLVTTQALAQPQELRWGGDAEGGAPFVEADPRDPTRLVGFDVEVAEALARALGRNPRFVQVAYTAIDQSVSRGDFDIGMSGVEDTPGRREKLLVTLPYFEFREVLTVREGDRERFRNLDDLKGRRIGTLAGTIAWDLLQQAKASHGIQPVSYDDDVHPYEDLAAGRLDGVVLDHIIATRAMRRTPGLHTQPAALGTGHYVGVLAKDQTALRDSIDRVLRTLAEDGTLERIYRKWEIWDDAQAAHVASLASTGKAAKQAPAAAAAPAASLG